MQHIILLLVSLLFSLLAHASWIVVKHHQPSDTLPLVLAGIESLQKLAGPFARYEVIKIHQEVSADEFKNYVEAHLTSVERVDISRPRLKAMMEESGEFETRPIKDPPLLPAPTERAGVDPLLKKAWGFYKIQTPAAWMRSRGSDELVVAVIDTGLDYNHEDLAGNLYRDGDYIGWDFVNNDALPYDDIRLDFVGHIGHGTHAASIIAARADNGVGFAGIAPQVKILPLKFLSASNNGEDAHAIAAFSMAVERGAKIINASWGHTGNPDAEENRLLKEAIEILREQGVLIVCAAGNSQNQNDGTSPVLPATYKIDNIISVTKSDRSDGMPWNSGYGKNSVHLMAPGQDVLGAAPNNKYRESSGTSFSVPHVVGALALVWSAHPEWSYQQVRNAILSSVDSLPEEADSTITGGRLNVARALEQH